MSQRIKAERERLRSEAHVSPNGMLVRLEEPAMCKLLKSVPTVFAFAEKLNSDYQRPLWADSRYGAK